MSAAGAGGMIFLQGHPHQEKVRERRLDRILLILSSVAIDCLSVSALVTSAAFRYSLIETQIRLGLRFGYLFFAALISALWQLSCMQRAYVGFRVLLLLLLLVIEHRSKQKARLG